LQENETNALRTKKSGGTKEIGFLRFSSLCSVFVQECAKEGYKERRPVPKNNSKNAVTQDQILFMSQNLLSL
jgi:hypothetical protein